MITKQIIRYLAMKWLVIYFFQLALDDFVQPVFLNCCLDLLEQCFSCPFCLMIKAKACANNLLDACAHTNIILHNYIFHC